MDAFAANPTIEGLADFLDKMEPGASSPACPYRAGGPKPALFWLPGQGGEMAGYLNTVEHYSGARPVYGLQSPALLGLEEGTTIEEIAAQHVKTIRSLQPCGPYHIVGYCFGGLLAFETARQLYAEEAGLGLVGVIQFDVHDMPFAPFRHLKFESMYNFLKNLLPACAEFFTIGTHERNAAAMRLLYRLLRMPRDTGDLYPPWTAERRLYDAHETAWRSYIPTSFPGVVTLFRPRRLPVAQPDPKLGWGVSGVWNSRLKRCRAQAFTVTASAL